MKDLTTADLLTRYSTRDVEVDGGPLRVAVWEPSEFPHRLVPTVLAVHGITANHLCWPLLAQAMPDVRIVAPDLRGRGRSNALPGPFGMPAHADDMARVLTATGSERAVVVGHSMGAFVSMVTADRHPDLVSSLVLVDGGLPLLPPPGVDGEQLVQTVLGSAAKRLSMVFSDHAEYQAFWRKHPAVAQDWNQVFADYVDYDLCGSEPELHSCTSYDAVVADSRELSGGESLLGAIERLQHPVRLLLAPRGLLNEVPPLYPEAVLEHWRERLPQIAMSTVADVNHYTIVMHERGIGRVADAVREALNQT